MASSGGSGGAGGLAGRGAVVIQADSKTLVVSSTEYNKINELVLSQAKPATGIALAFALNTAVQLASRCWDAQKFYADECERLREELRQLRTPSPTTTGEK